MPSLNFVAAVTTDGVIGMKNDLVYKIANDLKMFRHLTRGTIVVMGNNTFKSMGSQILKNRINIVLTRNVRMKKLQLKEDCANYMTVDMFKKHLEKFERDIFVIGGEEIFRLFLSDPDLVPDNMYITHIMDNYTKSRKNLTYFPGIPSNYRIIAYSPKYTEDVDACDVEENRMKKTKSVTWQDECELMEDDYATMKRRIGYRFLKYKLDDGQFENEEQYLNVLRTIFEVGEERGDRTGVGTRGIFGTQMMFDIQNTVPLLTTKAVAWKSCIKELLWFLRGDTDSKILERESVNIWRGNTSREFLDSRGLNYREGVVGPAYSWQWRFWGAEYDEKYADTTAIVDRSLIGGIDQLEYVIDLLKNDPFSRRIVMSNWNPSDLDKMSLPPCHNYVQFYVKEDWVTKEKLLSCHMYQRSQDLPVGVPFNIFSYTVLTYILAKKCNMKPDWLIISGGDCHIYNTHIQAVNGQLSRGPCASPSLVINDEVEYKEFSEITIDDFELIGYFPKPAIKMQMAV